MSSTLQLRVGHVKRQIEHKCSKVRILAGLHHYMPRVLYETTSALYGI